MKKNSYLLPALAALFMLCNVNLTVGQSNPPHVYHIVTWYSVPGLDSAARADRNALLKDYFEKVDMKNQYILHAWPMTHFFSDDSREMVTVYEYASWADIEKAGDRGEELEKAAWTDEKKRSDMMKKMSSYFTHHKDAIYSELPGMRK